MPNRSERMSILDRLEKGEISPEEAARLLSVQEGNPTQPQTSMGILGQLERGEINTEEAARRLSAHTESKQKEQSKKAPKVEIIKNKTTKPDRSFGWVAGLIGVGALLALLAGLWMAADLRDGSLGFGFFCAWVPMALGVLLLLLGWFARRGPWANVNFKSHRAGGHVRFDLNLPVPIGVAGKALHFVGDRIPALDPKDIDNLMNALEQAGKDGEPIQIHANSDNGDDAVDISIS